MVLRVLEEPDVDFDETARLAAEGFGKPPGSFSAEKMRWLYSRAFSHGTTVLALRDESDRKVGQIALVHQAIRLGAGKARAVALVDLFILKAFRSREAIGALYGEVERFCETQGIRFILGVPNESGARVNIRYLKMSPFLTFDLRAGVANPFNLRRNLVSADAARMGREELMALFSRFLPAAGDGLDWTPAGLCARLSDGSTRFGVHATETLLLISSPRVTRRVPHVLLCGFLARPGATVRPRDVGALVSAACALHRRPVYVYAGVNRAVPMPGWPLPARLRPSPLVLQIRDFAKDEGPASFDRFDTLDFDFA